jgi:hypothetical protein
VAKFKDLTGETIGRLKVLYRTEDHYYPSGRHDVMYTCKCECGNIVDVLGIHLRSGHTKSCGCYREFTTKINKTTHGMTNTRLYYIWKNMKSRCFNPNNQDYLDYGGRGITVCQEWVNDFVNFMMWSLQHGYNDTLTIDRINVNGNYEPSNCRWATQKVQCNNTRVNIYVELDGITHTLKEWCEILNLDYNKIHSRVYNGWDPVIALTT